MTDPTYWLAHSLTSSLAYAHTTQTNLPGDGASFLGLAPFTSVISEDNPSHRKPWANLIWVMPQLRSLLIR